MEIPREVINAVAEKARVKIREPLSRYTTFRTGGPADILVEPEDAASCALVVRIAREAGIPLTVIGGGSNLLVGDKGVDGIVCRMCEYPERPAAITLRDDGTICASASVLKERFIEAAVEAGFGGVEFLAGIPGCIGGGISMNAGTDMGTIAEVLCEVECVTADGSLRTIPVHRGMAGYRSMNLDDVAVITGAAFRLEPAADIQSVRDAISGILAERRKKHPLDFPSAGSVFKNPPGGSSWKLINDAGLKGRSVGGARVSDLHTNFIINTGDATSRDILDLIDIVRETVSKVFGVMLEPEVRMIGNF